MDQITVTLPLREYNKMIKEAEDNHVKNFIHKKYSDIQMNIYTVEVDQEAVKKHFGYEVETSEVEIQKLYNTLKAISETPITRGISPVEQTLHHVINMAKYALDHDTNKKEVSYAR